MLTYLYELLMSLLAYILGFFGVELGKKTVRFADDVEKDTADVADVADVAESSKESS
jgi:hypothetical protein